MKNELPLPVIVAIAVVAVVVIGGVGWWMTRGSAPAPLPEKSALGVSKLGVLKARGIAPTGAPGQTSNAAAP